MDPRNVETTGQIVSPTLVGRDEELQRLLPALARPPAVVVIEGEAGIGKTRLVAELASRPELADRPVLTGGCVHIREPFPLGPVVEALRGGGEHLTAAGLSPVTGALRPLLPELAHLLPAMPESLGDRVGERHRVFRGLAELIGSLGPVVLILEDMHWADEQTVEFLGYLLSDPPAGLCVMFTFRGEEVGPGVRALTARLPASVARVQVALPPFGTAATSELAASALGAERVSEDFASYLCDRASGLPFAIQELLALLRARGTLVRRGSGWARKTIDELDVPIGVRDSVLERVSHLTAAARAAVEAAAVLEVLVPVPALVATCRVSRQEALDGLDEALERGLLLEQSGKVGFRHLLAVQAVYDSIPLSRRQDLHSRAASAVRELNPVPLGQVAHHLRHAGLVQDWVEAAEKAADRAIALGDDSEAVRLLEAVLRHAPLEDGRRSRLAVKLGWASTDARQEVNVVGLLSDALGRELPRAVRGELLFLLAVNLERAADEPERQWQVFAEAVEYLDGQPALAVHAMVGLGLPTTPNVPLAEHVAWLERALEQLPAIDEPALTVFILGKVAMVLTAMGDPRWATLASRMLEQTGGAPAHRREVIAYSSLGMDACYAGHHEMAERLLTAAMRGAAGCDATRMAEIFCRKGLAVLAYSRGTWDGLAEEVAFLVDRLTDRPRYRALVDAIAACLALARGELDAARRQLDDVVDRCLAMGAIDLLPLPMSSYIRLATTQGGGAAVIERAEAACAVWEARGLWPVSVRTVPALVEALVTADRLEEAEELVSRVEQRLRGLDAPLAPAALAQARGLITAGTARWQAAADQLVTAAEAYDRLRCPYEAAQAREQAAGCLFRLGDRRAEDLLQQTLTEYGRLGARWDLDRAALLARRQGVSSPARHRSGPRGYGSTLSPREDEVARLAATGLSNKEIARELFLSAKTVDKHLGAALRKLGLHSRTALAHHLRDGAG